MPWASGRASELRAGYMDAVRVFPGRPRMSVRAALRVGTRRYVLGFLVGRAYGIEVRVR